MGCRNESERIRKILIKLWINHRTLIHVIHNNALNALMLTWNGLDKTLSQEPGTPLPNVEFGNCDMLLIEMPMGGNIKEATIKMLIKSPPIV